MNVSSRAGFARTPRVLLIGPEVEENLGLRYIAASLDAAGVESTILPFDCTAQLAAVLDETLRFNPDIVALSLAFQWRANDVLALTLALREAGYEGHITAGGHFATFCWAEILTTFPEFDSLCLGEAEHSVVDLATAVANGVALESVAGLALTGASGRPFTTPSQAQPDIDTLPEPDRRGVPAQCLGQSIATLVAGRGCYARCTFCCIAAWHERAAEGRRWRLRRVDAVADEMALLYHRDGIRIFIFHDDNFLPPGHARALERIEALAEALAERGVGRIATVIKARPNDVTPAIFAALKDRLGLLRIFLGIENDSTQGLKTLRRGVRPEQNRAAMQILSDMGIYVCFNLLLWDPDTGFESLETNLAFMEAFAETPHNFGRVELYAGTPLLARMQSEGRCRGDWMGWDYSLATAPIQRVFELAMLCFHERNFAEGSAANRLMSTRFDVEVARHFHPARFNRVWLEEIKDLSRTLMLDSVRGLREIVAFVLEGGDEASFLDGLRARLRQTEEIVLEGAARLEECVQAGTGARCRHHRIAVPAVSTGLPEQTRRIG
jgi:radical SAM superfamily enzyme YgiQ (UPF0313 family)